MKSKGQHPKLTKHVYTNATNSFEVPAALLESTQTQQKIGELQPTDCVYQVPAAPLACIASYC